MPSALRDDALGVPSDRPRLWWQVPVLPGPGGGRQTGYEIQLTRNPRGFAHYARLAETMRAALNAQF